MRDLHIIIHTGYRYGTDDDREQSMICGVDEAGRGPVIGPLVIAGVMVRDETVLRELGVKDSKQLARSQRKAFLQQIKEVAVIETSIISHADIDTQRSGKSLNVIEARAFADVIERLGPEIVYLDSADVIPSRFSEMVTGYLSWKPVIICEHRADVSYPVVSAASIVAKEFRDTLMDRIEKEIGRPVGSGYASDPVTINFIRSWIEENGDLPPYTRRTWATARRMLSQSRISKLSEWM